MENNPLVMPFNPSYLEHFQSFLEKSVSCGISSELPQQSQEILILYLFSYKTGVPLSRMATNN